LLFFLLAESFFGNNTVFFFLFHLFTLEKEKQARIAAKEALRKQKQSQIEAEVNRNKRLSHKNDKTASVSAAGDEERGSVINDLNI